jgi:hypothetical protein
MKLVLFVLKNKEKGVKKKEGEGAARNLSAGCLSRALISEAKISWFFLRQ